MRSQICLKITILLCAIISVECQKGTVQSGTECSDCPKNQYMDKTGQVNKCYVCPEGTETFASRSDSASDCISKYFHTYLLASLLEGGFRCEGHVMEV